MKCPMQSAYILGDDGMEFVMGECKKVKCEWWRETSQQCGLMWLAGTVSSLVAVLEDIRDRMPPPGYYPGNPGGARGN